MIKKIPILAITVFYLIAVSLRYVTEYTSLASHLGNAYYEILTGCGPAIGALIASKLFGIKIPLTLKGKFKNILFPFCMYWLGPMCLLSLYQYIISEEISILVIFAILIYGLCEEIGWRGFLQHTLSPLPKLIRIVVIAVLWYVWHLNFGLDFTHAVFFGILLFGSWGLGVVADKTKSLLALAAFHSLNNFFSALDLYRVIILVFLTTVWVTTIIFFDRSHKTQSLE